MTFALPKPSKAEKKPKNYTKIFPDGREKCVGTHYSDRKHEVLVSQGFHCARFPKCKNWIHSIADGQLHHKNGTRGLGGGKRDDRKKNVEMLCERCHKKEHGQLWA